MKRFVGRHAELHLLRGVLSNVRTGGFDAAAVVGEPGIGKTWLTDELVRSAREAGFQVFSGRGSEFEQEVPFALIIDTLDAPLGALSAQVVARLGAAHVAEMAAVFPSVAGNGGRLVSSLDVERFRSHYAVRAALEQLAKSQPILLVLDDVHWADPASGELIAHLLRHGVGAMMLVATYRSTVPMAGTAFGRAAREVGLSTLKLGPCR